MLAEAFVTKGAWISHLVLAEAVWVLASAYGHTRKVIAESVEMLLKHDTLSIQDAAVVSEALEHFRREKKVEFSDCLILETARKAGHVPVGRFERDFAKADDVQRIEKAND